MGMTCKTETLVKHKITPTSWTEVFFYYLEYFSKSAKKMGTAYKTETLIKPEFVIVNIKYIINVYGSQD